MQIKRMVPLVMAALLTLGCDKGKGEQDTSEDTDGEEVVEDTFEVVEDTEGEDLLEEEPGCSSPPECLTAPADHDTIGQPCESDSACGSGRECLLEESHFAAGEEYTSWPGGACTVRGVEDVDGCDPDDPTTCPSGSACAYFGRNSSNDRIYGCLDACSFVDTAWEPYGWNCGCRAGYSCSPTSEACFPGCSNDRECCEVWNDVDGDFVRDPGEIYTSDTCENYCDGDDPEEYEESECMASFECVNVGNPDADWHSECFYDSDCPPDAYCRNELHWLDDSGDPRYPGGICVKSRCELVPYRECTGPSGEDLGGECVNLNTEASPIYLCWATCHTGYGPEDGDLNPCRHPSGEPPYTCTPLSDFRFPPGSTNDGYCYPAMVPGSSPASMFEACAADEQCTSPLGLGLCYERMDNPGYCSTRCSATLAETNLLCGAVTTSGDVPAGVCLFGYCRPTCDTVHGDLGANGCPNADLACYGADIFSETPTFDPDGTMPTGVCLPACGTDEHCNSFWSAPPYTCNTTDGTCFD